MLNKVQAADIHGTFNKVSSLLDGVDSLELTGGESYDSPFEIDTPEGDYTAEGTAYTVGDVTFGKASIAKAKITAYSEDTEEVQKLPAARLMTML